VAGGTAGLIIGTLMGGPILGGLLGAATGALAGGATSIDKDLKRRLGEELGPNDSALCVVISRANWPVVLDEMRSHNFGGQALVADLAAGAVETIGQLAEDQGVAAAVEEEFAPETMAEEPLEAAVGYEVPAAEAEEIFEPADVAIEYEAPAAEAEEILEPADVAVEYEASVVAEGDIVEAEEKHTPPPAAEESGRM
jgi:hypothetical protein